MTTLFDSLKKGRECRKCGNERRLYSEGWECATCEQEEHASHLAENAVIDVRGCSRETARTYLRTEGINNPR